MFPRGLGLGNCCGLVSPQPVVAGRQTTLPKILCREVEKGTSARMESHVKHDLTLLL